MIADGIYELLAGAAYTSTRSEVNQIPWPDSNLVAQKKLLYAQELPDIAWFQQNLAKFGYAVSLNAEFDEPTINVITAFQMKYRPALIDGMPDAETAAILDVLTMPSLTSMVSVPRAAR